MARRFTVEIGSFESGDENYDEVVIAFPLETCKKCNSALRLAAGQFHVDLKIYSTSYRCVADGCNFTLAVVRDTP